MAQVYVVFAGYDNNNHADETKVFKNKYELEEYMKDQLKAYKQTNKADFKHIVELEYDRVDKADPSKVKKVKRNAKKNYTWDLVEIERVLKTDTKYLEIASNSTVLRWYNINKLEEGSF